MSNSKKFKALSKVVLTSLVCTNMLGFTGSVYAENKTVTGPATENVTENKSYVTLTLNKGGTPSVAGKINVGGSDPVTLTVTDINGTKGEITLTANDTLSVSSSISNSDLSITGGTLVGTFTHSTGSLTLDSRIINAEITNGGTLTLGDGVLKKDIKGDGKTIIDGDVNNKNQAASIAQKDLTINEGKSLSVNDMLDVKNITNAIDNKGTFAFNGGTLAVGKVTNTATATVKATGNGHVDKGAVTTGTLEFGNNVANATNEYLTSFTNATVKVSEGAKMTLNRGTEASGTAVVLTKKIEGDGTLKFLGTETYETDADNLQIAQSEIATGGKLTLTAGTFVKAMEIAENAEVTLSTNATLGAGSKIIGAGKITGEVNFTGEGDVTLNADTFSNNQGLTVNVPAGKTLVLEDGKLTRTVTVADDGTVKLAGAELGGEYVTTGTLKFGKKDGETTRSYSVSVGYVKTVAKAVDKGVTLAINGTGSDVLGGNISNKGTLELKDVASVGTADKAVDIINDGTMTIDNAGEIVVYGNIKKSEGAGDTMLKIKSGKMVFEGIEIHNPVTIEQGATMDPDAGVFKNEVTNYGTLVLEGGTLGTTITNNGTMKVTSPITIGTNGVVTLNVGSTLSIPAANFTTDAAVKGITSTNFTLVDGAKIQLLGETDEETYYVLFGGENSELAALGLVSKVSDALVDETGEQFTESEVKFNDAGTAIIAKVSTLSIDEMNLNSLAGIQQGMVSMQNITVDTVAAHMGLINKAKGEGKYSKEVWASYLNNKDNVDGFNMAKYDAKYNGVTVGVDFYSSEKSVAGVALTYAKGDVSGNGIKSGIRNDSKYYGISFYDRVDLKNSALLMDLGYMNSKNETNVVTTKSVTGDAKVDSYTLGVRWEKDYQFKNSKLVPFAGVRYLRLNSKDFSNSRGLNYSTNSQNLFQPKIGVAWAGDYKMNDNGWNFKPKAEVGYLWALGNREADTALIYKGHDKGNVLYDVTDKSSYYAKLGIEFNKKNFAAGVDYSYMKGSSVRSNRWNVNLSWSF